MKRVVLVGALLLALAGAAQAFQFGLGNRFGRMGAANEAGVAAPSTPSVLLINTGSALLINTGSKFLIHN